MRLLNLFSSTPSIRRRISSAFLILTVFVLVMAVATYIQLGQVKPFSDVIVRDSSDMAQLQRLSTATAALDADLERYLVIRGIEYQESAQRDLEELVEASTALQSASTTDLAALEATISQLKLGVENVLESVNTSSGDVNRRIVAVYANIEDLKQQQKDLTTKTLDELQAATQNQSQIANNVQTQFVLLSIIVLAIAIVTTITTDRRLRTISTLTDTATEIAAGDLTRVAPVESNDEIGTLAEAFNAMTSQLQDMVSSLEQRIADRTRALETSTEVSRRLSTILDKDQLVKEVVEQLVTAFDYYYAHIYLFEEDENTLVMKGGTGEAGQVLLARGHTIQKGRGLVGRAAKRNELILVGDTLNEEGWQPNDLLPETRAEVAIPIAIGDEVLGVFDVQHNIINGITEEDANLLQSIANQVAIAVQNAQVYVETQHRADRETLIGDIGQKIQNTATVEDALQVAVRELGRALNAEHSTVQLSLQAEE